MPAFGAIALSDDIVSAKLITSSATVGANRTLSPDVISPQGVARWADRTNAVVAAQAWMTHAVKRPVNGARNYKVTHALGIPTLETLGSASYSGYLPGQKVGYQCAVRTEWSLPERSTYTERNKLLAMYISSLCLLLDASDGAPSDSTGSPIWFAVRNLETVY